MVECTVHRAGLFAENLRNLFTSITLLDILPFVETLASFTQADLELGQPPFVNEQFETDNAQPFVLQGTL